jgi:tight adherence protein C
MSALLVSLMIGAAIALFVYSATEIYRAVPDEDRTYRDRPPKFFRVMWPLILLLTFYTSNLVTKVYKERTGATLKRAGLEYALSSEQFFAGKLLSAIVYFTIAWLVGSILLDSSNLMWPLLLGLFGFFHPNIWLRDTVKARNLRILRALPFFLDVVTLSIEAGLNLTGALQQAVAKCPPSPLIVEITRLLREVRAGKSRQDTMREMAERLDFTPISSLVSALIQGEITGSSLGPILRAQAEQRRSERFQRAEKLAMEAPVKMLGPLVMFIFPCTFVVIGFPIAMKFMQSGL